MSLIPAVSALLVLGTIAIVASFVFRASNVAAIAVCDALLVLFCTNRFASVRADDAGIYVKRWRREHFVPWRDVLAIDFSLVRKELTLRLKERVGGDREVVVAGGIATPSGVSPREYWSMVLGRSEPEPVKWIRRHMEKAKAADQNTLEPPAG